MKTLLTPAAIALSALLMFSGCVASLGSGTKTETHNATLGQQLVDLKKARDAGAMTDAEYEAQKTKLLERK
jgi:hypothetical protein